MVQFHQEGPFTVSSPIYVSLGDEGIKKALACGTHAWETQSDETEKSGRRIIFERCSKCAVATRMKYTTPAPTQD